jgi:hypothetical protein
MNVREQRAKLYTELDALLERLAELTPDERAAFVERFGRVARAAGVSADDTAAAMRDLAARLRPGGLDPCDCRDWRGRAWSRPGEPRADAACEPEIETTEVVDDGDASPRPVANWRELALRAAAVWPCHPEPPRIGERNCAGGLQVERAAPF